LANHQHPARLFYAGKIGKPLERPRAMLQLNKSLFSR
jgi:hypothetical protein